jgi:hypothetical protein
MNYQPIPDPGSEEFEKWIDGVCEGYENAKPSIVLNERKRPKDQDIFDWLMEDKELVHETDRAIREAGFSWW